MDKRSIRWIIAVMSIALIGIIGLQVYWILHDIHLKEQQFEQSVNQAMNSVVDRIETSEAMSMLHERFFSINPDSITSIMLSDTPGLTGLAVIDTSIEVPEIPEDVDGTLPIEAPWQDDLDNADINIEFHRPGSPQSFLRVQRRNLVRTDSISRKTIRSSQITRIYGDSAEIVIRQNEEKIKARMEKFNEVMQRMAIEYAGNEEDVRKRLSSARLDSLLTHELTNRGINLRFNYGVLNGSSNTVLLANKGATQQSLKQSKFRTLLFPNDLISRPDFLILQFPATFGYFLDSMWLMVLSSTLFTFIIVFGFAYTIHTIIRQKKLSDIKTDFINNMTHEFKTPIATISLAVDSIQNPRVSTDPAKMEYFTRIIREENKRMNSQVENVLQMAQIDKGELTLRVAPVDLHEVIRHAVEQIRLQVDSKGGQITFELNAGLPVVDGDQVHLSNVIFNLLDNANKYSATAPEIRISTSSYDGGILVKVSDNGIGMSRDTQKRIFEKFYRVPTGNIHDIKGFGLGLSYVQAIISEHNGWIRVESEPGQGSTFEFFLPHHTS